MGESLESGVALLGFPLSSGKILLPLTIPQLYFPAVPQPAIPPSHPCPSLFSLTSFPALSAIFSHHAPSSLNLLQDPPHLFQLPWVLQAPVSPLPFTPTHAGEWGDGVVVTFNLPHPISSLKARGLCSFGGPLPAPSAGPLDRYWIGRLLPWEPQSPPLICSGS